MTGPTHRARNLAAVLATGLLAAGALAACTPSSAGGTTPASPALPPTSGTLDYQLGQAYGEPGAFDVVGRDVTADPMPGAYNVCYVNGFQTQPGSLPDWERTAPDALLRDAAGDLVVDPEWPDEVVLDPTTPERREAVLAVVGPQIRTCAEKGFDAVELDNLDTFLRFDGLDRNSSLALARAYADLGHALGLAVGQKNAADVGADAREVAGFDLAVVEECAVYDECGLYREVYGNAVLQIEYTDDLDLTLPQLCALPDRAPLLVVRDRLLVGPDDPDHVRADCD